MQDESSAIASLCPFTFTLFGSFLKRANTQSQNVFGNAVKRIATGYRQRSNTHRDFAYSPFFPHLTVCYLRLNNYPYSLKYIIIKKERSATG